MPTASTSTTGTVRAGRGAQHARGVPGDHRSTCGHAPAARWCTDRPAVPPRARPAHAGPHPSAWRSRTSATISVSYSWRNGAGYKRIRRRYQRTERESRGSCTSGLTCASAQSRQSAPARAVGGAVRFPPRPPGALCRDPVEAAALVGGSPSRPRTSSMRPCSSMRWMAPYNVPGLRRTRPSVSAVTSCITLYP